MVSAGDVKAMVRYVQDYVRDEWTYSKPPEGARLEIHPAVRILLLQDPEVIGYGRLCSDDVSLQDLLELLFKVPVKVSRELEPYTWRLVIVTEDVKTGGRLGDGLGSYRPGPERPLFGDRGGEG